MITTLSDAEIMNNRGAAVELITGVFPEFCQPSIIVPLLIEYSEIRPTLYNSLSRDTPTGVEFRRKADCGDDSIPLIRILSEQNYSKLLIFNSSAAHVAWTLRGSIHEIEHAIAIAAQVNFSYSEFRRRVE